MRRCIVLLMLLALLTTGIACAGDKSASASKKTGAPTGANAKVDQAEANANKAPANDDKAASAASAADADMPVPPPDAQWTIYCKTYSGPDHIVVAKAMRDQLRARDRSMPDWYVVHGEGESTLYYGFYRVVSESETTDPKDAREAARFQRDRKKIDMMTDATGNRPFRYCHASPFAGPDPAGPPEWNLENANGYWTIQIAAYSGSPMRKQYAVDAVREARAQGIEAYYHHGSTTSSVCIGAWPEQAVRQSDEVRATNSTDPLFVLPPGFSDAPKEFTTPDGQRVQTVTTGAYIEDPTLLQTMKQYPNYAHNGELVVVKGRDVRTRELRQEFESSRLVRIPQREESILRGDNPPDDLIFPQPQTGRSKSGTGSGGGGRLKSIGD